MNTDYLRPSILPKLALCGQYRSEPNAGTAAARGALMDTVFRMAIAGDWEKCAPLPDLEADAVMWAIETAIALAGGECDELEAREEFLRIEACGMTGTADLLCEKLAWSADLKSGQVRNYLEQQAAYALGFMERLFVEEWTVYLIFCDAQTVVSHRFTQDEAKGIVLGAVNKSLTNEPPTPNEYCGWCANRFTCAARLEQVGFIADSASFESQSSDLLRQFVLRAGAVEDFAVQAREILKSRIIGGEKVEGCAVASRRGARKVSEEVVLDLLQTIPARDVIAAYGPMPEAKFKAVWESNFADKPFPAALITEAPGTNFLRVSAPKLKVKQ